MNYFNRLLITGKKRNLTDTLFKAVYVNLSISEI